MNRCVLGVCAVGVAALAGGCVQAAGNHTTSMSARSASTSARAVAVIRPASGSNVHGTIRFRQTRHGVNVTGDIRGLTPGLHGFHVHQYGDCSAADASSAGGHYNPEDEAHGGPDAAHHHAGDFGNIRADADGEAHVGKTFNFVTIDGVRNPLIGRAVVVHAGKDDLASQPSGAAGARVGCGVIGWAKPGGQHSD